MNKHSHGSMNFVVSISLFTVFAILLTLVLLMGASSFKSVSVNAQERYEQRTPLLYVSQKIRGFDRVDSVKITETNGINTLVLSDEFHDIYIYEYNGYLTEFLAFSGDNPRLEIGISLFKVQSVKFELDDFMGSSLIKVTIDESEVYVSLTSGGGA